MLRQIQCGFDSSDNPRVCCPIQTRIEDNSRINSNSGQQNTNNQNTNNQNTNNQNLQYDIFNNPLLPTECGKDLTQRILGGERAGLDEYPWMTLLEYLTCKKLKTDRML